MYQPYPGGGQVPQPQPRMPAPRSVQTAVKFMYAGAALSAIGLILGLVAYSSVKRAIIQAAKPPLTTSQLHTAEGIYIGTVIVVGLISIGLWLWMARANLAGKSWARTTATVFFGLNTLFLLLSLVRPHAGLGLAGNVLVWLVGLGAIVMLYQKDAGPFFSQPR